MNVETLHDLFASETHRMYGVENRLVDALATLESDVEVDALDDSGKSDVRESLRSAVARHRSETEEQAGRLETVLTAARRPIEGRSTPALDGIVEEKELFNNVVLNDEIRPLYYLWTAERIERLEVTAYEQLLRVGSHLDQPDEVIDALERNLSEEVATLETLEELSRGEDVETLLEDLASRPDHG